MNKVYNISQLARETNVSRNTLYDWISKGWLEPVQKSGSRYMYDIDSFKKAQRQSLDFVPKNYDSSKVRINGPTEEAYVFGNSLN